MKIILVTVKGFNQIIANGCEIECEMGESPDRAAEAFAFDMFYMGQYPVKKTREEFNKNISYEWTW